MGTYVTNIRNQNKIGIITFAVRVNGQVVGVSQVAVAFPQRWRCSAAPSNGYMREHFMHRIANALELSPLCDRALDWNQDQSDHIPSKFEAPTNKIRQEQRCARRSRVQTDR